MRIESKEGHFEGFVTYEQATRIIALFKELKTDEPQGSKKKAEDQEPEQMAEASQAENDVERHL